ncbi:hypothetical protein ACROYT_G033288 [Oculina patagonica]
MWKTELQDVKEEFRLIQFRLLYSNSGDFAESPWFSVPVILVFRLIVAVYCSAWIIYSGFHPANGNEKWFIYLTNWSFLFVTLYFVFATIITALYYKEECKQGEYEIGSPEPIPLRRSRSGISRSSDMDSREKSREDSREKEVSREKVVSRDITREKGRSHEEVKVSVNPLEVMQELPMSCYHQALWVIYNIAANTALLITATNWDYSGFEVDGLIVTTQILNTVFILLETLLGTVPVRLFHVIYPMLFTVVYIMFSVIYWADKGTNTLGQPFIYSVFDYSGNPSRSIGSILGFFFLGHPLAQLVLFLVIRVRCWLRRKFSKKLIW